MQKSIENNLWHNKRNYGRINGFIEERISGQYVVKAFEMENKSMEEFSVINNDYRKVGIKAEAFAGLVMPLARNLNGLTYAATIVVAGILGVRGTLSIGDFTTLTRFARQFGQPINEIANQFSSIQLGLASAERCFEIIDEKIEIADDISKVELENVKGEVKIEGVYFGYDEGKTVLKNINLDVKPGEVIAIVGPTGAGKTTIVNLLTRFYDVNKGRILIDGIDIRDMSRKSLREAIGMVLQDTVLFAETVRNNILFGKLDATEKELETASEMARADEFINHLRDGYDTLLNEDGGNLSVGQRQLLNIARVFINQPKILILDEATSNVDTRTEVKIQEAMLELMKGRTSFVIAHRLSTIRNADKIIVIDNGQIIEAGTHKELIEKQGRYYQLYTGV
ncbi:MAG: ABC transporter ATP-binding protein [Clostridia bacterium]|nr:ABC transporter ATP-binding protein [Clostridia bacterium]